jgi:glycosyltransferase involved in cell wall biosynthesis
MASGMHIVWIHRDAAPLGGAERYVARTVELLRRPEDRHTLLYDPAGRLDRDFVRHFDAAFPLVDAERQTRDADVVYAHRVTDGSQLEAAARNARVLRFVHDHALFCPREHKYTLVGSRTCTQTVGAGCISCTLGVVRQRTSGLTRLGLVRVDRTLREIDRHRRHVELVVASRYLENHALQHGFDAARVHHVPLYVEPQPVVPARRDPHRLLFVGALLRSKGLDLLLDAVEPRPELHLHVVGEGEQRDWLESEVRRRGLGGRVRLLGRLDDAGLARERAEAGVFVMPSRAPETFGLAGAEAMAAGLPVVASAVGGVGEWLIPGRTGLSFPSDDARALGRQLDLLGRQPELARRIAMQGVRFASMRLTASAHVAALRRVLFESSLDASLRHTVREARPCIV